MKPTRKFARFPARGDRGRSGLVAAVAERPEASAAELVEPPTPPEPQQDAANAGTVDEVLARVGDDLDAAADALAAEQAASRPRSSLVAALEQIVSTNTGPDEGSSEADPPAEDDDESSDDGEQTDPEATQEAEGTEGE